MAVWFACLQACVASVGDAEQRRGPGRFWQPAPGPLGSSRLPVPEAERGVRIFFRGEVPAPGQFTGSCCHDPGTTWVTRVVVLSDEVEIAPTTDWS